MGDARGGPRPQHPYVSRLRSYAAFMEGNPLTHADGHGAAIGTHPGKWLRDSSFGRCLHKNFKFISTQDFLFEGGGVEYLVPYSLALWTSF
jgi:hypothetical protein